MQREHSLSYFLFDMPSWLTLIMKVLKWNKTMNIIKYYSSVEGTSTHQYSLHNTNAHHVLYLYNIKKKKSFLDESSLEEEEETKVSYEFDSLACSCDLESLCFCFLSFLFEAFRNLMPSDAIRTSDLEDFNEPICTNIFCS